MTLAIYGNVALIPNGTQIRTAPAASIEVRREDDGTLADIFSDREGNAALANPFDADSSGRFAFYVAPTLDGYKVTATAGDSSTLVLRYQHPEYYSLVWLTGAGAPSDANDGENGDLYFDTTNNVLYGPKASGSWGSGANLRADWLTGSGAPSDETDGEDGDMYLDADSGDVYGPKSGGAWGASVGNIKGADGEGLEGVVDDESPQLGGDLDVNGKSIISVSNGDIPIVPDGTGSVALNDKPLKRPSLIDYGEVVNAIGSIGGGTQDIDLEAGNVVSATVDTSETTFTFSNPAATGVEGGFKLYLTNGGSQTVNWPASVEWPGGSPPSLTSSGLDALVFSTIDGGTTWYGFSAGLDLS